GAQRRSPRLPATRFTPEARVSPRRLSLDASRDRWLREGSLEDRSMDEARERRAGDRRDPEEPELRDRPAADEERRSRAARGIHRRVRDRDADQVDERQREPDRDPRESDRRAEMRRA